MQFMSDNAAPVPQQVLDALAEANRGYARSYGNDPLTGDVQDQIRALFEAPEAAVHLVATGTAANALSLACLCPPWATVYCHRHAHIAVDECGAPEFFTGGAKLTLIDGADAKMTLAGLQGAIGEAPAANVHSVQPGAVSLTNVTEKGAVYTVPEVRALSAAAKSRGLPVHMDGARFANALVTLGCTPAELTWKAGVDVLSFGGTKNGLLGVEAVILFDPSRAWELELRRKRAGHLFSKHRYLSAQMAAYLKDDLWLKLAARANRAAARLSLGLRTIAAVNLLHPTEANIIFATWPVAGHRRALAAGAAYDFEQSGQLATAPEQQPLRARLVCSWSTTDAEVDQFLALIAG